MKIVNINYSEVIDSRTLVLRATSINSVSKSYMPTYCVHNCVLSALAKTEYDPFLSATVVLGHKTYVEVTEQKAIETPCQHL